MALAAIWFVLPATATTIPKVTDQDLVRGADLIFQGVVTRIDHRKSAFRTQTDAVLPHTFITFQVERILKGRHTASSSPFTMRHLGGPDSSTSRYLQVKGCPTFDVGERVVIFVRLHERSICPIVGWSQGRFRIVNGAIFNDSGREVWLGPQRTLSFGPKHDLAEVRTHHRGGNVYMHRVSSPPKSEGPAVAPPTQGTRLSVAAFLNYIGGLVTSLHTTAELARLAPVRSAAPDEPFYMQQPSDVGDGNQ